MCIRDRYLLLEVSPKLIENIEGYDLQMTKVIVWETENAYAEATLDAKPESLSEMTNQARNTIYS